MFIAQPSWFRLCRLRQLQKRVDEAQAVAGARLQRALHRRHAARPRHRRRHDRAIPIGQAVALFDVERRHEIERHGLHVEARPRLDQIRGIGMRNPVSCDARKSKPALPQLRQRPASGALTFGKRFTSI